ncbi:MAG TPA: hypothetical protein VFN88_07715, partial [Caulobacteraceae bacterium]|nr:hypothetical protein [Caulobacteraceae bacterium]
MIKTTIFAASAMTLAMAASALAQPPAPGPVVKGATSLTPPADAPPEHTAAPGPFAVSVESDPSLPTHTLYRPTDLKPFTGSKRLPIIAWGNGACSNAGQLFSTFLTQIASHGYFIVVS